jgi:transposase
VRHGITSLFAAFNIADGTVISELHRSHRATEFKKFLTTIDKTVPAGLDIHLVCDNYATHKTPAVKAWLAAHPRVHLHFTPTGSSWITQVERWFGFLTDQMIRRGAHRSVQALETDIRTWIADWNEDPKPFVWKKTAEEILDSLSRYLQRISGAGHEVGIGISGAGAGCETGLVSRDLLTLALRRRAGGKGAHGVYWSERLFYDFLVNGASLLDEVAGGTRPTLT